MKRAFLSMVCMVSLVMMTACGGGGNAKKDGSEETAEVKKEAKATLDELKESGFAIKLKYEGDAIAVYTRKGSNKRLDMIYGDGSRSVGIEVRIPGEGYTGYDYDGEMWTDESYYGRQEVNNFYAEFLQDLTRHFTNKGYAKTGRETICGRSCDVYSGKLTEKLKVAAYGDLRAETDEEGEIVVWNGITMRTKIGGKVKTEVVAMSFNIPDEAFTKTENITWIK